MLLLDGVEQLQTVELASLQPDVEQDETRPARGDGGNRLVAVARRSRAVALVLQNARDELADICLVVNYEDFRPHDYDPTTT